MRSTFQLTAAVSIFLYCYLVLGALVVVGKEIEEVKSSANPQGKTLPALRLVDATGSSGISFIHDDGSNGKNYLPEFMGAGVASLDYDNDGWIDCYFLNGCPLPRQARRNVGNALFRNLRNLEFSDVSTTTICNDAGYGLGVAAADYNNDGFVDLYISNFGANSLLRNNGDGTFTDETLHAGVQDGEKFGAGVLFLDVDGDGNTDLFCANYVAFDFDRHAQLAPQSFPFPPGPKDFPAVEDSLFLSNGDGTFSDVSQGSGIASVVGPSMGAVACDFNDDGNQDIFVCCDGAPNHLFQGMGDGRFEENSVLTGVAYDGRGIANGSMGVEVADLNADNIEDLFITDYSQQYPMLFMSIGGSGFDDQSRRWQVGREVLPHVNWGAGLVDFDHDGDRDLFICNGHFLKNVHKANPSTNFRVPNTVLANEGGRGFSAIPGAIQGHSAEQSSRGAAFDDFDNDGDIDVVILNCNAAAQVLCNQTQAVGNWAKIKLISTTGNRDAIGARVTVETENAKQAAWVHSGRSYQSHFGGTLHFGLGKSTRIRRLTVRWPCGQEDVLSDVATGKMIVVIQSVHPEKLRDSAEHTR